MDIGLQDYMDRLLHWSDKLSLRTVGEMELAGLHLGNGYFLIGRLHISDDPQMAAQKYLDNNYKVAEELFERNLSGRILHYFSMTEGDLAILLCFPYSLDADAPEFEEALKTCERAAEDFHAYDSKCIFTLLLSDVIHGYAQICWGWHSLKEQLQYVLFMGQPPQTLRRSPRESWNPGRRENNPQFDDNAEMNELAGRLAAAIDHRQAGEVAKVEKNVLDALFRGNAMSLQPVHFRLYVFQCAFAKALEIRHIVSRRDRSRRDYFFSLSHARTITEFQMLFYHLVDDICQTHNSETPVSGAKRMQQIRLYCDEHFREHNLTVSYIAAIYGMSQPQLSASFKQQYGINLLSYLNGLRVQEVKRLLRETELPQDKIAVQCGFISDATMRRVFQSIEHCTPGAYRRQNQDAAQN